MFEIVSEMSVFEWELVAALLSMLAGSIYVLSELLRNPTDQAA